MPRSNACGDTVMSRQSPGRPGYGSAGAPEPTPPPQAPQLDRQWTRPPRGRLSLPPAAPSGYGPARPPSPLRLSREPSRDAGQHPTARRGGSYATRFESLFARELEQPNTAEPPAPLVRPVWWSTSPSVIASRMQQLDTAVEATHRELSSQRDRLSREYWQAWTEWRQSWRTFRADNEGLWSRLWDSTMDEVERYERRHLHFRRIAQVSGVRFAAPAPQDPREGETDWGNVAKKAGIAIGVGIGLVGAAYLGTTLLAGRSAARGVKS